jgi:RNA polymerase sigma-70 factor (ECF subfamily)
MDGTMAWRPPTDGTPARSGGQPLAGRPVDATAVERLMARVARGDREAFEALYDHVAECVYGLARQLLGDGEQAERSAAQALVTVWREAPRLDATGGALGWILATAHREAVDAARAQRASFESAGTRVNHTARHDDSDGRPATPDAQPSDGGQMTRGPAAVELAYFAGCTYHEIAEAFSVPSAKVATLLRDALRRAAEDPTTVDRTGVGRTST